MVFRTTNLDDAYRAVERFWRFDRYEIVIEKDGSITVKFWND